MKWIATLANIVLPAAAVALVVGLAVEYEARLKQVDEHQRLADQLRNMAVLAARCEQLSNQLARASAAKSLPPDERMELLRLRGQLSVLHQRQDDLVRAREENRQAHAVLERYRQTLTETNARATADYWPQDSWANAGHGSPEATLQTILWAGAGGDVTNFFASVADEAIKLYGLGRLSDAFNGKSAAEISARLADDTYNLKSVQILAREVVDDNTVSLTVELENRDNFQTVKMLMKREGGEWKFAGPQPQ